MTGMMLIMTTDVPAKKSLGQNWLVNPGVLARIEEAAAVVSGDTVLEVGPGHGALTALLAETGAQVFAIEKDHRLIEPLREQFAKHQNVHIIEGDILTLEPASIELAAGEWKLVANIPYYLTSHLIRLMLETWPSPSTAVLMVQEEVAKRIVAKPPEMNLLALSVQLYAVPEVVMHVSRGSFRPMPTVDSAVIHISPDARADRSANGRVMALAKQAFAQKRKQLGTTLGTAVLLAANIPPKTRPQELSIDDWRRLEVVSR